MSIVGAIIDDLASKLAASYPTRTVTRTLRDYRDYKENNLQSGIYTLIANKVTGKQFQKIVHFILAADISVAEGTDSKELEEQELTCSQELETWAYQNKVDITDMHFSRQLDSPYGWVRCNMQLGPIDLTNVDVSSLNSFDEIHIEHNLGSIDDPLAITEESRPYP